MTIPDANEILELLRTAKPQPTFEAPRDARGIYGLFDHTGTFRYIGSTSSQSETFYKRIHRRHRTGSENTSHYFSYMYNSGRLWRRRNDPGTKADGDIAKKLRNAFIARHCSAVWVPLPDHADISALEAQVIALAPAEMIAWNRRGMEPYDEPEALVDALIEELDLKHVERAAVGRQLVRFRDSGKADGPEAPAPAACPLPALPEGPFRFFALDVETANHDRASICQVGLACVRADGRIESWVALVNPGTDRWVFSDLHGITADMVNGASSIAEVVALLDCRLKGKPVYQHSGFDRSAIRAACAAIGRSEPDWDFRNSVTVARDAWPELKGDGGHGLASLKQHLGLQFQHHDAGEDARAAAEVVLRAERAVKGVGDVFDVIDDDDHIRSTSSIGDVGIRLECPASGAEEALSHEMSATGVVGRSLLTQGNLNNYHFYLREFISAFPSDVIGGSNKAKIARRTLTIDWGGSGTVTTDIDGSKKIFRDRSWVRSFFQMNTARSGDTVEIVETEPLYYRVRLVRV